MNLSQSGDSFHKLCLSVAVYTGNTDYFAPSDRKREIFDAKNAFIIEDIQILNFQNSFSRCLRSLFYLERYRTTYHHCSHFIYRCRSYIHNTNKFTSSNDSTSFCYSLYFIKLMSNENDALTFRCKILHNYHKFVYFLRCKYSCRFVENKNICISIEHLQNLDSLLHTYCYVFDDHIRFDLKTVVL